MVGGPLTSFCWTALYTLGEQQAIISAPFPTFKRGEYGSSDRL